MAVRGVVRRRVERADMVHCQATSPDAERNRPLTEKAAVGHSTDEVIVEEVVQRRPPMAGREREEDRRRRRGGDSETVWERE